MGKSIKITCDQCGEDVSSCNGVKEFRLHLSAENREFSGGAMALNIVYPPVKEDHYFCDLRCLTKWVLALKINKDKISRFSDVMKFAPRTGAEEDKPEGARYITISDTLANEVTNGLESLLKNE